MIIPLNIFAGDFSQFLRMSTRFYYINHTPVARSSKPSKISSNKMKYLNRHIVQNHIKRKAGKTHFLSKQIAIFVIRTILARDESTTVREDKNFKDRLVLSRRFATHIGLRKKGQLFVGKVVITAEGTLITAFPSKN